MIKYFITCEKNVEGLGCKVAGAYEYPASVSLKEIKRIWRHYCKEHSLKLLEIRVTL